jgi:hypothetical protein
MRHDLADGQDRPVAVLEVLLLSHAAATLVLAGVIWTVQLVVYPGFDQVGPTAAWPAAHAAHTRRMSLVVGPPWAVQGLCIGALLLWRPDGVPTVLVLATAVLATLPVIVTVAVSVPLHRELARGWDPVRARRLRRTNWPRTASWTLGAVCALALVQQAA